MELGLQNTMAFVAGASQGLGKAVALGLAREGCRVALCARRPDELDRVAEEIKSETGLTAISVPADLTKPDEIERAIRATVQQLGRLDILVTNAGGPPAGDFTKQSDEAWHAAYELNLMSAVRMIRAALPHLQKSGRGRIINLTSTSVKEPIQGLILSNSIRAGVIGLAKTLSVELAPYGITVNNIAPGRFDTDRIRYLDKARAQIQGTTEAEAKAASITQIPLGRYGQPEELANLAVFLASDKAAYITGTTIQVDGGMMKSI
ncbi:MAG TPA: SDR family oxidoreductase [Chloroflexia bacterium]|nr:SDR family oxidoreductase [Chloroflexia bacterium]